MLGLFSNASLCNLQFSDFGFLPNCGRPKGCSKRYSTAFGPFLDGNKLASFGEVLVVASPIDAGITVWDLRTGAEIAHLKSCASPRHSLACVSRQFIAASQVPKPGSPAGGAIFFWVWNKAQPEFRSYPVEPIGPLACTSDGSYVVGGGVSGRIYIWEVSSGRLLRVWAAHYKAITCLVLSDDESLLISGADDGFVNVWPLLRVLDLPEDGAQGEMQVSSMYTWSGHTLGITGLFCGCGGSSAIIVSCSLDTLCKVWSLALGNLLRTIKFPAAINAVVVDPGEYSLYAGSNDGRIFVAPLNFGVPSTTSATMDGMISTLIGHSRSVTALAFSMDGVSLASASEDCSICLWDTVSCQTLRIFKHNKGPVSDLLVISRPAVLQQGLLVDSHGCIMNRRVPTLAAAPLSKYVATDATSQDLNICNKGPLVVLPSGSSVDKTTLDRNDYSLKAMERQIKEFEQQGSTAAMQLELERLRSDRRRALIMIQQWQQVHQDLYYFCVEELMGGNRDREGEENERDRDHEKGKKGRNKIIAKAKC